jgi:hypothetical protein
MFGKGWLRGQDLAFTEPAAATIKGDDGLDQIAFVQTRGRFS